ncbi:hypothetical protein HY546_00390 [archaeon]|nr:hypothetical protein [archaeon]
MASEQTSLHQVTDHNNVHVFNSLGDFSNALTEVAPEIDAKQIAELRTSYMQATDDWLLLSLKDFDADPNNIIYLSTRTAHIYTKKKFNLRQIPKFDRVLQKPYGITTIAAFLMLSAVFDSYRKRNDQLVADYNRVEENFNDKNIAELSSNFMRFYDRLEDFIDIIEKIKESSTKEVETKYISFDYSLLEAEANHLLDRVKTRIDMTKDIAANYDMKVTRQLNERMEKLSDIVKRLTAITIVIMVPNLIAGHFGMNFKFMPELNAEWTYPLVVLVQVALVISLLIMFRKKEWI